MIEPQIIERLDIEVDRLRTKYNPKTTDDLVKIAEDEFGAQVVNTPLGLSSLWKKTDAGLFIFYFASFKPYEPITLAHEIGHLVAGHHDDRLRAFDSETYAKGLGVREKEADYFSARLNNVSQFRMGVYRGIEAGLRLKDHVFTALRYKEGIEKLRQQGVYEAWSA